MISQNNIQQNKYDSPSPHNIAPRGAGKSVVAHIDNRATSVIQKKLVDAIGYSDRTQLKKNDTGLPLKLKNGIEDLSGLSMDDVRVHYNSSAPAQLHAHAFAQGNNIHIAGGQEKFLPHEAWHVVQQKQGRVKATAQMKGKVNINDDKVLEQEADRMGARAMHSMIKSSAPRLVTVAHNVFQLKPSKELLERKGFIENRIEIILDFGPNPTRLQLLEFDVKELEGMQEPDEDGQLMLRELLQKVHHFIGLVTPEAGLMPHTIVDRNSFEQLKLIFHASNPPLPAQQDFLSPKGAKDYAEALGEFHDRLTSAAKPLGFKILARFFVEGGDEHVVHPGINSWARFNAFKPFHPQPLVPFSAARIRALAKEHMTLGHDTGDEETAGVIKNSPLFSGTEKVGTLIKADSPFAEDRLAGLIGMPAGRGAGAKAVSSSSMLRSLHKPSAAASGSGATAGKGASDRIIKLIWGFDSFLEARNLNSRGPVAVANRLIFIAIPLTYPHLYTPEQIGAAEKECCTLERENTVFAQLTNIKSLAIGSLPNYFPLMQIHTEGFRMEQRSEYIELMRSGILDPNSYVNIKNMDDAQRKKFISDLEVRINAFRERGKE
jgi:hypothetical protein